MKKLTIIALLMVGSALSITTQVWAVTADDLVCSSSTGCVDSTDIKGSTVTSIKIRDGEVKTADILNETITNEDISGGAAIAASKISDGSGSGLDADSIDGVDSTSLLQNGQDATVGGLTVSGGNITSASDGDICIGQCD